MINHTYYENKFLLIAVMFWASNAAFSQTSGKAPTKKEPDEIMKQAQKGLSQMSPEQKKMMDSMGIKLPSVDMSKSSGITDKQLREAYENEQRTVPKKDVARIASISLAPLNAGTLSSFLQSSYTKALTQLKPTSKSVAEEIYQSVKKEYGQSQATGNAAMELWMLGRIEPALYIAGRACLDDPSNMRNLNNYAAMLSMMGAEQLAIPVLNYLNMALPKNTTVLNNIGQAWFGLGDMVKAYACLDTVTRIYPRHPQAAFTKAAIKKEKGDKTGAIEEIKKAIEGGWTNDKADELRKMGIVSFEDNESLPSVPRPDAMGLKRFIHPEFPRSAEASVKFDSEWNDFKTDAGQRIKKLEADIKNATAIAAQATEQRAKALMAGARNMNMNSMSALILPVPPYSERATRKFQKLTADFMALIQQKTKEINDYKQEMQVKKNAYKQQMEMLEKEDLEQSGEGMPNKSFCPQKISATDAFLSAYNPVLQEKWDNYLQTYRQYVNDAIYLFQYMYWQEDFQVMVLEAQKDWLLELVDHHGVESIPMCTSTARADIPKFRKLPGFDDVHCEYHSAVRILMTTFLTDCSRLTTEFDTKFFKFKLKEDLDKKDFGDQFMGCTVEIAGETGGKVESGPLKAETKVGVGVAAEFDRKGLKDLTLKAAVKFGAGTNDIKEAGKKSGIEPKVAGVGLSDLTISAGVKGEISLISGKHAVAGTGTLSGLNRK